MFDLNIWFPLSSFPLSSLFLFSMLNRNKYKCQLHNKNNTLAFFKWFSRTNQTKVRWLSQHWLWISFWSNSQIPCPRLTFSFVYLSWIIPILRKTIFERSVECLGSRLFTDWCLLSSYPNSYCCDTFCCKIVGRKADLDQKAIRRLFFSDTAVSCQV